VKRGREERNARGEWRRGEGMDSGEGKARGDW
jgi:hypothetical protein